jgi:hypothetical protein
MRRRLMDVFLLGTTNLAVANFVVANEVKAPLGLLPFPDYNVEFDPLGGAFLGGQSDSHVHPVKFRGHSHEAPDA